MAICGIKAILGQILMQWKTNTLCIQPVDIAVGTVYKGHFDI